MITDKSSENIIECYKMIFKERIPKYLWTDQGKEYFNKYFKEYLRE